jgi:hypothetical protein
MVQLVIFPYVLLVKHTQKPAKNKRTNWHKKATPKAQR